MNQNSSRNGFKTASMATFRVPKHETRIRSRCLGSQGPANCQSLADFQETPKNPPKVSKTQLMTDPLLPTKIYSQSCQETCNGIMLYTMARICQPQGSIRAWRQNAQARAWALTQHGPSMAQHAWRDHENNIMKWNNERTIENHPHSLNLRSPNVCPNPGSLSSGPR